MKRRIGMTIAAALFAAALLPSAAHAAFGLNDFDVTFTNQDGTPATQAGSHPFALTASFDFNYSGSGPAAALEGDVKDFLIEQTTGFIGSATAMPRCSTVDFGRVVALEAQCPASTAVGEVAAAVIEPQEFYYAPVFNVEPPPGVQARLGFAVLGASVVVDVGLKNSPDYNIVAGLPGSPQPFSVYGSKLQLWGNPADPAHDRFRGNECLGGFAVRTFQSAAEVHFAPFRDVTCPTNAANLPFLTLPRACEGPGRTSYEVSSWQEPGLWASGFVDTHDDAEPPNPQGFTGCDKLGFTPKTASQMSTDSVETGSGLDFDIDFHDEGLENPEGIAQSDIKKVVVTLPEGVTINPSVGEGLKVCTRADYERESLAVPSGQGCPNGSKIGTVFVRSPLIETPFEGSVYLAQQDDPGTATPGAENPFDSLIAIYIVVRSDVDRVLIKIPAKVEPDPKTGQLVTSAEEVPQLPFSHFNFHFREGQRAPLISPATCGIYTTKAELTPRARPGEALTTTSSFRITRGLNGGPCPSGGVPPFHPGFQAGSVNNAAGSFSPFNMRLIRGDGEQDMTKFSSVLPPGELGSLAGVGKCPDSAIDVAKSKTGRQELASPSCPASSEIGHTLAGAGVGSALTYVPGQVYLGGSYKGDPLSVISITPAVAGPFDAGTVVVRLALTLNPRTAEVEVDGAASDPIPHIIKGIVLKVRDLRVYVDRPNFTINPTSCNESSAKATLFGSYLDIFSPADDQPTDLSTRFQAADCQNLGFKPKLALQLKGGTKRGGHPGLLATYRTRSGDANLDNLVVRLPRSAFLDQAHIRTICTRVQFAAKSCPSGAQYGFIKAWTPLLDDPLEGPVWLRSSNHKLPDLVFDLHGLVDIEVATRIDSAKGGIRASLEKLPDAPLSKVLLRMQGGKKGLIINSRSLCGTTSKANVEFGAQNGKESSLKPVMQPDCGGKRKGKRARR